MSENLMLIDIDQCTRCYTCEIACKQENNIGVGPRWRQIATFGPRSIHGDLHLDFVPTGCLHCDDPLCAKLCPTNAITKREDGIVIIDPEQCNGCQLCVYGCPYGSIQYDQERSIAGKCHFCLDRIDHGQEPSCVQHCISGALQWIKEDELEQLTQGMHTAHMGRVCYRSTKWKLSSPWNP